MFAVTALRLRMQTAAGPEQGLHKMPSDLAGFIGKADRYMAVLGRSNRRGVSTAPQAMTTARVRACRLEPGSCRKHVPRIPLRSIQAAGLSGYGVTPYPPI